MARRKRLVPLVCELTLLALLLTVTGAEAGSTASVSGDWLSFGRTVDQLRHSPLTQITKSNVRDLGRVFTLDLTKLDPGMKKGQQSFPLVVGGTIYMTSADDQVVAVDGVSGKVLWRFNPDNSAIFKNFGIVANRGVAYCDGKLFLTTLDMRIDALDVRTGRVVKQISIGSVVPGAQAIYGYSETSAPICYDHLLLAGAAGSDYGVRGFFMAYHTSDLSPAWANPYWTIPPEQEEWRSAGRLVGGGADWTPATVDPTTNTVYFNAGTPAPLYYPGIRPGPNPRTDSVIALDLRTGLQRWWQELMPRDEWGYDPAQPPLVFSCKIHGKRRRILTVATKEGVWFAFDARTGVPVYQRVKVIDQVEHPSLKPGKPVVIYPASIGGVNYSPASYDPSTNYVYNAAAETASVLIQQSASRAQRRKDLLLGNVFRGLANGDFGQYLRNGWKDYGSISAIDVGTGRRVWKFNTPQPERGGVTTTVTGLGFAGGGDGVLRAFDTKNGKILWTFQTGHPIAGGPSIYAVGGKEYLAITVGGTPTSSKGGTASELQVFAVGGRGSQSSAPVLPFAATRLIHEAAPPRAVRARARPGVGSATIAAAPLSVQFWSPSSSNMLTVHARVLLHGKRVAGARVAVDRWRVPAATDANGTFSYPVDISLVRRHVVSVVGVAHASIGGHRLSAAQQRAVLGSSGGISVGYRLSGLSARKGKGGTVVVNGRVSYANGKPPPTVVLYTYRLHGAVTDANGKPVANAIVTTRTNDRNYWTQSGPSNGSGQYTSFLVASDQAGDNPVPLAVGIAVGRDSYTFPFDVNVSFSELHSAVMNIRLPSAPGGKMAVPTATVDPGAIYEGLLVGVVGKGGPIRPVSARWPDRNGRFQLVLPASMRGKSVVLWEQQRTAFSRSAARPGGLVDLAVYPTALRSDAPQALATLKLP